MRRVARLIFIGLTAIVIAATTITPARTQSPAARIDAALQSLDAPNRNGRIGYATIWDGNKFVQCRRLPDGAMRCEAAGTLLQPSLASVLTPTAMKRLAALNWLLDQSFGNYARVFPSSVSTRSIADDIVTALTQVYDAQLSDVQITSKLIADIPCPPRVSYSQNLAGSVNNSASMQKVVINTCAYARKPQDSTRAATSASELVAMFGPRVTRHIEQLRTTSKERAWVIFAPEIGYVQCMCERPIREFYCEAQSAQSWPALGAVLTPDRIRKLKQAGYVEPGRAPNYSRSYLIAKYSDAAIAAEILSVLYQAYGFTGAGNLETKTGSKGS